LMFWQLVKSLRKLDLSDISMRESTIKFPGTVLVKSRINLNI
jgi:hypothetical protein